MEEVVGGFILLPMYQTEQIDKLFLELSQFTQAKTQSEIKLQSKIDRIKSAIENILQGISDRKEKSNGIVESQLMLLSRFLETYEELPVASL